MTAQKKKNPLGINQAGLVLAEWTGLEPATPGVTGRYSNRLNYHSIVGSSSLAIGTTDWYCRLPLTTNWTFDYALLFGVP